MKLLKTLKHPNIDKMLADKYNQETVDIQEWLTLTEWSKPVTKGNVKQCSKSTISTYNHR
jgi:hypothetical protein